MTLYELSLRNAAVGGPVVPAQLTGNLDTFKAASKITFLVHGFNKTLDEGSSSLRHLASKLKQAQDGLLISVLWPGDHHVGAMSYSWEGNDADLSAYELSKFILLHARKDAELNFISHSLGARVVLGAVDILAWRKRPVNQICVMAAAIDADSLARSKVYRRATEWATRVAVLSSVKDEVLGYAYPLGDLLQAFLFAPDSPGLALGLRGPRKHKDEPIPAGVHDRRIDKERGSKHGHYIFDPESKKKAQDNQKSAARYADAVVVGESNPQYP